MLFNFTPPIETDFFKVEYLVIVLFDFNNPVIKDNIGCGANGTDTTEINTLLSRGSSLNVYFDVELLDVPVNGNGFYAGHYAHRNSDYLAVKIDVAGHKTDGEANDYGNQLLGKGHDIHGIVRAKSGNAFVFHKLRLLFLYLLFFDSLFFFGFFLFFFHAKALLCLVCCETSGDPMRRRQRF